MPDKRLLYTSDDNFSLYIENNNNKFTLSLFDNEAKLEYNLADYVGDIYIINKYNQDKFIKYFFLPSKNNKLIKHNMISYIRSINSNPTTNWNYIIRSIKVKLFSIVKKIKWITT